MTTGRKRKSPEVWTDEQEDLMLELWFCQGRGYSQIAKSLGRITSSLIKKLDRMMKGRLDGARYVPKYRTNREGRPWTMRERVCINALLEATDKEIKVSEEDRPAYLARIFGRETYEVERYLKSLNRNRGQGFGLI